MYDILFSVFTCATGVIIIHYYYLSMLLLIVVISICVLCIVYI